MQSIFQRFLDNPEPVTPDNPEIVTMNAGVEPIAREQTVRPPATAHAGATSDAERRLS